MSSIRSGDCFSTSIKIHEAKHAGFNANPNEITAARIGGAADDAALTFVDGREGNQSGTDQSDGQSDENPAFGKSTEIAADTTAVQRGQRRSTCRRGQKTPLAPREET
jgi:hypothetical protein